MGEDTEVLLLADEDFEEGVLGENAEVNDEVLGDDPNELLYLDGCVMEGHEKEDSDADYFLYENCIDAPVFQFGGKRIVDIDFLFEQLKAASNHSTLFGCSIVDLIPLKEKRLGLHSRLFYKCKMCNTVLQCETTNRDNPDKSFDVNESLLIAASTTGCGFTQMDEILSTLDIPCMSFKLFAKTEDKIGHFWKDTAQQMMKEAADEERIAAIERGDVDEDDKIPYITVITDATWGKRSYRKNYSALSGAAAIVGQHTGKVLFMDVKNKYCRTCNQHEDNKTEIPPHDCNRNFEGSSSAMEAALVCEGFKSSVNQHGLRYLTVIADGDSSVYKTLIDEKPYQHRHIEKIECKNHLLRNFRNKIEDEHKSIQKNPALKKYLKTNLDRIRKDVASAIKFRVQQNKDGLTMETETIENIKADIENVLHHVCGDHSKCPAYIKSHCKTDEINHIPEMIQTGILEKFMKPTRRLIYHSTSLFWYVNNNVAEHYNSIVAKFVGGKRINFSLKQGYSNRCSAAVVQFNTQRAYYNIHQAVHNSSPKSRMKKFENRKLRKTAIARSRRQLNPQKRKKRFNKKTATNSDYGTDCCKPDLSVNDYIMERNIHLTSLIVNHSKKVQIERATIGQAQCGLWHSIRKMTMTASRFGDVCRAKKLSGHTKNIVHNRNFYSKATEHGRIYEETARKQLEIQSGKIIEKCGIFIDDSAIYLAATPDGLIGDDGLVEIKCPYSIAGENIFKSVLAGKIKYLKVVDGAIVGLQTTHPYFYQIQGQLHVTNKLYCVFAVWTATTEEMYTETIFKDDEFWKKEMEGRLEFFFFRWLLPEIIDSRQNRGMNIEERYTELK